MSRLMPGALALLFLACTSAPAPDSAETGAAPAGPAPGSVEWKIEAYSSAAPPAIAANATVLDWNDSLTAHTVELRGGTNGWTCLPLMPPPTGGYTRAVEAAPMCADSLSMVWAAGYMGRTTPANTSIGLAYMLHGDLGASNIDPFATAASPENDWVATGPHVMVFPADPRSLNAITSDHRTGGPWVMWKGTTYAHVMMPVTSPE